MKKSNVFTKYLFWQLVLPISISTVFIIIYSVLFANYYYLPSWLDFSINATDQLSYIATNLCMFISIGTIYYAVMFLHVKEILLTSLISLATFSGLPFWFLFLKTVLFDWFSVPITSADFKDIMENDYLFFFQNITKVGLAIVFILVVGLFARIILKQKVKFIKPYLIPKGAIQETALVYYLAWFIYSFVLFVTSESQNVLGILIELVYALAGYFLCVYGAKYLKDKIDDTLEKVSSN